MDIFVKVCMGFSGISIITIVYIVYKIESDVQLRIKRYEENRSNSINNIKTEK